MPRSKDAAWQGGRLHKFGARLILTSHAVMIVCSAAWFISPAASIGKVLDPAWSAGWSAIFGVFGTVALVARLRKAWRTEATCTIVMSLALLLWGVLSIVTTAPHNPPYPARTPTDWGGLQAGFRFVAGALFASGWSFISLGYVGRQQTEQEALARAVTAELARRQDGTL